MVDTFIKSKNALNALRCDSEGLLFMLFGILNATFSPFSLHISRNLPYFAASKIQSRYECRQFNRWLFLYLYLLTKKSTPLTAHVSGSGNAPEVSRLKP